MVAVVKVSQFNPANPSDSSNKVTGVGGGDNFTNQFPFYWTTATRPLTPFDGLLGYNTDIELYEFWKASLAMWVQLTTEIAPPSLTWNNISGASATMLQNNGYVANNNASQVILTLPTVCEFGQSLGVCGYGSAGWKIIFNAGQTIVCGNQICTTSTGALTATNQFDQVEMLCVVANTTFITRQVQGNLTVT